jgi:putative membrane protein
VGLFLRWLAPFLGVLLAAFLFQDRIVVEDYAAAAVFALVLALLNAFVRPILGILTFPITLLTLGLFHFVLNAIVFGLAAAFVPGVQVMGAVGALLGALVVSVVGMLVSWVAT